jgi:hypothetical protein
VGGVLFLLLINCDLILNLRSSSCDWEGLPAAAGANPEGGGAVLVNENLFLQLLQLILKEA